MKVLAVDDSHNILDLIKDTLSLEGIEVETADNGAEALSKYVKFKPDIVTLDVTMPIMNGFETLSRLIQIDKNAKIIMLTAAEHWSLIESCLARGAIGYLQKPFYTEELVKTIKDPWHYEDKNIITLFSISCNRISTSLEKIFKNKVSIIINNIKIAKQEISPSQFSPHGGYSQIRIVVDKLVSPLQIEAPQLSMGFVNEFSGQLNGKLLTFLKFEHVGIFRNAVDPYYGKDLNEFFYIVHSKIFSSLVERSHLRLQLEPPRLYDETSDKNVESNTDIIKVHYEIKNDSLQIPLETQLCANLRQIFRT